MHIFLQRIRLQTGSLWTIIKNSCTLLRISNLVLLNRVMTITAFSFVKHLRNCILVKLSFLRSLTKWNQKIWSDIILLERIHISLNSATHQFNFWRIFLIMEQFDYMLSSVIDSILGQRCSNAIGYKFSEIVRSPMSIYFCSGLCETNDVIHNTLGCLIGAWVLKVVYRNKMIVEKLRQ